MASASCWWAATLPHRHLVAVEWQSLWHAAAVLNLQRDRCVSCYDLQKRVCQVTCCVQVFGDLTWVPFIYSLQARYLADHPQVCSFDTSSISSVLSLAGVIIAHITLWHFSLRRRVSLVLP